MWRNRWMGWSALALTLILAACAPARRAAAAPVADDESPLAQVPAESPIVVQMRGVERTKERLIALIKNAVPDLAKLAEDKIEAGIKEGLQGRELKGMAKDGPIFLAFTEMPKIGEEIPKIAVIVKVTKYADFRDGILTDDERKAIKADPAGFEEAVIERETVYFVDAKSYAIVTSNKDVAEQFTKKQPGLDKKLDKTLAKKLLESDVSVYVDTAAVRKEYGEQIKEFRKEMEKAFEEGGIGIGGANKGNLEMMKLVIDPAFQAFEDSKAFLFTVEFRPEGLAIHAQATVEPDSKTNSLLKASKPTAMTELAGLPAGRLTYTATHLAPELLKKFGLLVYGISNDPDSKEAKTLADAVAQIAKSNPTVRLEAANVPPGGIQAWTYEDPVLASTNQLRLFEALKDGESYLNVVLKEKPTITASAKKHRGYDLHHVSMAWDLEATVAKSLPAGAPLPPEFQTKMVEGMKKLMGDGAKMWFGSDGKKGFVSITAEDWESAQKLLDAYLDKKGTVGEEKAYAEARKHLPQEITLMYLIDLPTYAAIITDYAQSLLGVFAGIIPFPLDALTPAGKGKTAFMGFSVTLQPERGSVDFWLPASAVSEIYKMYGDAIKKAIGAGGS
jgi:hypothetical protein